MEKRVAIVGAGISSLLACKYTVSICLSPIVFEEIRLVDSGIITFESTRLHIPRENFQFSDFPWPSSADMFPSSNQLSEYVESYAQKFKLLPYIKFNSKVINIDYVGESEEEMQSWELWGGAGNAFGSKGKWILKVLDNKEGYIKIQCLPLPPEFPPGHGPEVFSGKVLHSMDYSAMDNASAAELIIGKRIVILGSAKSAVDLAFECANANGNDTPCTVIQRTNHWMFPDAEPWGVSFGFWCFTQCFEKVSWRPC